MEEYIDGELLRGKLQEKIDKIEEGLLLPVSDSTRAQIHGQIQGLEMARFYIHQALQERHKEYESWKSPQPIPLI